MNRLDEVAATNSSAAPSAAPAEPLLQIEDLSVSFKVDGRPVTVVRSATLSVGRGEVMGLVGESGSGKTITAMAAMGLVRSLHGSTTGGRIMLEGQPVTDLNEAAWSRLRGKTVGMVFQQPTRTLNPAYTVGEQIAEVARHHWGSSRKEAWARAVEMLDRVHIADAAKRAHDYPHQFSGGMCQRAAIAMALVCDPKLLIADEPTTALDVTVQARILELIQEIRRDSGIGVLFITHDLGVVAQMCDNVAVMYAGEVVERADIRTLFRSPRHPYTEGLLRSLPTGGRANTLVSIPGQVPAPTAMPTGCRFSPRCEYAVTGPCTTNSIESVQVDEKHWSRCVLTGHLQLKGTSR